MDVFARASINTLHGKASRPLAAMPLVEFHLPGRGSKGGAVTTLPPFPSLFNGNLFRACSYQEDADNIGLGMLSRTFEMPEGWGTRFHRRWLCNHVGKIGRWEACSVSCYYSARLPS